MKFISWNVNGINSCIKQGLIDFMRKEGADFYCFQEIKSAPEKLDKQLSTLNYESFWNFAQKKGYSGLAIFSKHQPLSVINKIGNSEIDKEARVLALEFEKFFLINAYFPHSNRKLERLDFKLNFNKVFLEFCQELNKKKPIIIASDFNVAHTELDLKNPKQNKKNAGFTIQERNWFDEFLKLGHIDTFREFISEGGHYTWWTYRNNARQRNIGWRIDYLIVSQALKNNLKSSKIIKDIPGSDHCPISLELEI